MRPGGPLLKEQNAASTVFSACSCRVVQEPMLTGRQVSPREINDFDDTEMGRQSQSGNAIKGIDLPANGWFSIIAAFRSTGRTSRVPLREGSRSAASHRCRNTSTCLPVPFLLLFHPPTPPLPPRGTWFRRRASCASGERRGGFPFHPTIHPAQPYSFFRGLVESGPVPL